MFPLKRLFYKPPSLSRIITLMWHIILSALVAMVLPGLAYAQSGGGCLNYWSVGPSGCDGSNPPPPVALPRAPAQPQIPSIPQAAPPPAISQAKPMDPVEEFYQTYDKPPRAFVEFQINPTPANAVAWVKEYQDIINKSSQTADAWRQAESAFDQYAQTGRLPDEFSQALSNQERQQVLTIIQGLDADSQNPNTQLPPALRPSPSASTLPQAFQNAVRGVPMNTHSNAPTQSPTANPLAALNRGSLTDKKAAVNSGGTLSMAALNRGEDIASGGDVIKVNYYFSAVCPFCRKFEPELARVQQQFTTKRLDITCVDMTPGERVPSNKQAHIDCQWRPLGPGEKDANQVRATPSLVIDFGPTKSLELVEGYVDSAQLLSYLNTKVKE